MNLCVKFIMDKNELTVGSGSQPRGLSFTRNYSSNRRYDKSPGLGYGWSHNYDAYLTFPDDPDGDPF